MLFATLVVLNYISYILKRSCVIGRTQPIRICHRQHKPAIQLQGVLKHDSGQTLPFTLPNFNEEKEGCNMDYPACFSGLFILTAWHLPLKNPKEASRLVGYRCGIPSKAGLICETVRTFWVKCRQPTRIKARKNSEISTASLVAGSKEKQPAQHDD